MDVGKVARRGILAVMGAMIACPAAAEPANDLEALSYPPQLKLSQATYRFSRAGARYDISDRLQLFLNLKTPKTNPSGESAGRASAPRAVKLGVMMRW